MEGHGQIHVSNPWLSRHCHSRLLGSPDYGSGLISTRNQEVFGLSHPIKFRIGNGGAGYTGILRHLAETYIDQSGGDFGIAWVSNHSRHSQIALLAGVVHVALTYEPENEDTSVREGWAESICRAFNDHFILAGPEVDLHAHDIVDAFCTIAGSHAAEETSFCTGKKLNFHSRGDGSATFAKEQSLWEGAGIDAASALWIETYPLVPYDALVNADKAGAFILTDRSTYLTAKRDGVIPSLRVHAEGGEQLLNPCSVLVASASLAAELEGGGSSHAAARDFAEWLGGESAQQLISSYGGDWPLGLPLFTVASKDDFDEQDLLVSRPPARER